jgi:hypothetical protein
MTCAGTGPFALTSERMDERSDVTRNCFADHQWCDVTMPSVDKLGLVRTEYRHLCRCGSFDPRCDGNVQKDETAAL